MAYPISMKDKVVLITGGTAGIGAVTAHSLAGMGATTVIVGRDPQKTAQKVDEIRAATGSEQVSYLVADLSSQAQVRRLAEVFQNRHNRLDVLINNAGAFFIKREESADGIEMTFALNHLSYFLLTHLLLNLLEASKPARIINVSSEAHRGVRMNFQTSKIDAVTPVGKPMANPNWPIFSSPMAWRPLSMKPASPPTRSIRVLWPPTLAKATAASTVRSLA